MATLTVSKEDEKRVKAMGFLSNKGTDNFSGRVITRNGKITAEQMKAIAAAAAEFGDGHVVFTTRLTVEVTGIPYEKIDAFRAAIEAAGMITGGTGAKVRPVVSCKGTTCQYGLIDTYALSEEIHERFFMGYNQVQLPHKCKIAVGGCPNNCVKPDLNDIGIVGQHVMKLDEEKCKKCKKCGIVKGCPVKAATTVDGELRVDKSVCTNCGRCEGFCYFDAMKPEISGYRVYVGGRWGKQTAHGRSLGKIFTTKEEVLNMVEKVILFFREQGIKGERLAQTIERIGFDKVEAELLYDDILARKQQILDGEIRNA